MKELYQKALLLIKLEQKASIPFFQRKLMIGFVQASKLIDMLEENKIIGKEDGAKPRKILIK